MSEESHSPSIEPELEARIIAMVLGEASDFERDELLRLIEERPELAEFLRQMQRAHGLLLEVGEGEVSPASHNWKLPTEKRNAVLAAIRGDAGVHKASTNGAPTTPLRAAGRRRFLRSLVGGAVVLASLGIGGLALFSFSTSEKAEQGTLAGIVWDNERYNREPLGGGTNLTWQFENESLEGMENARRSQTTVPPKKIWESTAPDDNPSSERHYAGGFPSFRGFAFRGVTPQAEQPVKESDQALSAIQDTLGTFAATTNDHDLGDTIQFFDDGFKFEQPLEAITKVETGSRDGLIWMDSEATGETDINSAKSDSQPNIAAFSVPNTSSPDSNLDGLMLGLADSKRIGVDFDFSLADTKNLWQRPALTEPSPEMDKASVGLITQIEQNIDSSQSVVVNGNDDAVMLGTSPSIIIDEEEEEPLSLGRSSIVQSTREQTWDLSDTAPAMNGPGLINGGAARDSGTELSSTRQQQVEGRASAGWGFLAGKGVVSSVNDNQPNSEELRFGNAAESFGEELEIPTASIDGTFTDAWGASGRSADSPVATGGFGIGGGGFGGGTKSEITENGVGGRRFDQYSKNGEGQPELPVERKFLGGKLYGDSVLIASDKDADSEQSDASGKDDLPSQIGLQVDLPAQTGQGLATEDTRVSGGAADLNLRIAMPPNETGAPAPVDGNQNADTNLDLRGPVDVRVTEDFGTVMLSGNNADVRKVEDASETRNELKDQPTGYFSIEEPIRKERQLRELSIAGEAAAVSLFDSSVAGIANEKMKNDSLSGRKQQLDRSQNNDDGLDMSNGAGLRYWFVMPEFDDKTPPRKHLEKRRMVRAVNLAEKLAADEAFSTFSLHVSDVSFKLAMAALGKGEWPESSKIRIEEFVNAFDYGDPLPGNDQKVACAIEQSIHPFLQQRNLLRVSMRTAAAGRASETPLRLTLLLDNSGSMERYDRQQTVRRAFAMLAQQLTPNDQVTLISFARQPRLLADQVSGSEGKKLVQLIDELPSEGGTNIEAALQLAYEKAAEQQTPGAQNRIILLTDGAVNLGNANPESLSRMVTTMRNKGIAFDAAGISSNGLNDEVLEALTRKGDGRYYLLDSLESADDGFAQQIAGALRPSAKNVKVQVEFNPKRVGQYKLLGFEKHVLKKEDFRNDKVDAAEMAAAEAGVAMYQFEALPDGEGDIGSVSVRFLDLSTGQMVENRWPIPYEANAARPSEATPSLRIASAAALFASRLKGDALGASVDLKTLTGLLSGLPEQVRNEKRVQQLQQMIEQARQLSELE